MDQHQQNNLEAIYPLSPTQQGMLFHTLYVPAERAYLNQLHYSLQGGLNVAAFRQAWDHVIAVHPVLRTLFVWENRNQPLQVVRKRAALPWTVEDWRDDGSDRQQRRLRDFLAADRKQGFRLDRAPLMRCALFRLADDRYEFVWTHHHSILDGWSGGLVNEDVLHAYEAICGGRETVVRKSRAYKDYIAWLQRQDMPEAEAFWKKELHGISGPTPIRLGRSAGVAAGENAYADQSRRLPPETAAALKQLARTHHVTLSSIVQGAWGILLSRYCSEETVLFGVTVSGRPIELSGMESMVGLFINTLPVRLSVDSCARLIPWLKELVVRQVEREQFAYCPLVDIQKWSGGLPGVPLFDSILVFENHASGRALSKLRGDIEVGPLHVIERTNYPLTIVAEVGADFELKAMYRSERFAEDTIARLLDHLQTLLTSMATDATQTLSNLRVVAPAERAQLLSWGAVREDSPCDRCLHEVFAEAARKRPNAVAVVEPLQDPQFPDRSVAVTVSYRQLNHRANQLANYLRRLGVGPDVLVGICVERSVEMIVAVLGILKAGGAYVPLDPSYPENRLALMIDDARICVLLTQEHLRAKIPESTRTAVIPLDAECAEITSESTAAPTIEVVPDNAAYVIYTSGSTGTPKGVVVTHGNVMRLFAATRSWFLFDDRDVWALFHSYSFDFSVWEMWGALLHGGRLVIVPYFISRSFEAFYNLLRSERVTVLNQTPSAFRQFSQVDETVDDPKSLALRLVIFGGEALELQNLQGWFERHGDRCPQLVNMYGITETTVHVTYRPLSRGDLSRPGSVIGRPIPDLTMYLLDESLEPAPIGASGEIYVGGAGLARGYLGRSDLTAERFVPDPFAQCPGARLYRSGDLGRYLPDGDIEYLGRLDLQVKIRGFRIELGEIESVLAAHPEVRESAIIARQDEAGARSIVAYVIPRSRSVTATQLWRFVHEQLPDYMIPAAFILLESMPLTINGKIDQSALPAPNLTRPKLESRYVAPRNVDEELLTDIWAQVLGHKKVGIHDNIFELGGDSILSIWIMARAQKAGLRFSLQQLFQHQTIAELARVARQLTDEEPVVSTTLAFDLVSSDDRGRLPPDVEDAYPLASLQAGMLYHCLLRPEDALYHNVSSFHLKAPFAESALREAIDRLTARHGVLRTSFDLTHFSEPLQLVHRTVCVMLTVDDLQHLPAGPQEDHVAAWFRDETQRPFDPSHTPLLRLAVHRRSRETFQLSLTEHHAILDGWSVASLITELFQHYFYLLGQGDPPPDEPPLLAYRDFVAVERHTLAEERCREFWDEKLRKCSTTYLPTWLGSPLRATSDQPTFLPVPISRDLSDGLKSLAQKAGTPLKSVLLAAHLRVLSSLTNQRSVTTGLVSNGRLERADGDQVLGLFLNTLPFRVSLLQGTWIDLVKEVFHAELEMLPYRRYPLAEIQRRSGRELPFDTTFNFTYFHVYEGALKLAGLEVLDGKFHEKTNFAMSAEFRLDPLTAEVNLALEYDHAKLSEQQIGAAIGRYYVTTLEAMVRNPAAPYGQQSMLPDAERRRLLVEQNDTRCAYPRELCVHQLFEQQAERRPQAIACSFGDHELTYRELNNRVKRLARRLWKLGARPETLVGVCLERSIEMVIGLLGILKAGGAYVPLDPTYPRDRLGLIVEDAQMPLLLTRQAELGRLPAFAGRVVLVDEEPEEGKLPELSAMSGRTDADNLAYIIYTSGSTGKPKGVEISHRSLTNFLVSMSREPGLNQQDILLAVTTISFDIAALELYLPLVQGGQIVLASREETADGVRLAQRLLGSGATVMQATPATWRLLIAAGWQGNRRLKILCGGEALPGDLAEQLRRRCASLWNLYGPTETTVWSSCNEVLQRTANAERRPPPGLIGKPIANTQLYLLDQLMQPVPIAYPGELYIGGEGLARGYHQRPDLTAEKFVPDPFSNDPSARLYRTGDVARYEPDGRLVFLGRVDHQVKIRGYRLELGDVESVLASHPGVRQAVVTVHRRREDDARLVAYVVAEDNDARYQQTIIVSELRRYVKQQLPDYMAPAAYVLVDQFPLTPTGKIDRRALPAPEENRLPDAAVYVAPQTGNEQAIGTVWREVLGTDQVGIDDNFFHLGGHSLLLARLQLKLQEVFNREIRLVDLFRYPTIRTQAEMVSAAGDNRATAYEAIQSHVRKQRQAMLRWKQRAKEGEQQW